jgi:hypothetical protein
VNHKLSLALLLLAACSKQADSDTDVVDTDTDTDSDTDTDTDSDTDTDTDPTGIALAGSWDDVYGGLNEITDTSWDLGYALFEIVSYDNDAHVAIAQNDAGNFYYPGLWSRFDWTTDDGEVYFCQTAFDA